MSSSFDDISPAEIRISEKYILVAPVIHYMTIAAAALYVWDFLLTFKYEVALIWAKPVWTFARAGFFLTRYGPMVLAGLSLYFNLNTTETKAVCIAYVGFDTFASDAMILVSQGMLVNYLLAIYDYKRSIVITTVVAYATAIVYMFVFGGIFFRYEEYTESGVIEPCTTPPSWLWAMWLASMIFDAYLVVMVAYKSASVYLQSRDKRWAGARLFKTLTLGCTSYYIVNFLVTLFQMLVFRVAPLQFNQLGATWIFVTPPLLVNRLSINMNQTYLSETLTMEECGEVTQSFRVYQPEMSSHISDAP